MNTQGTAERYVIEALFRVVDKEGNDTNFVLNPAQERIDQRLTGRDLIPKARQEGVSTYFLARYTAKCLSARNTRAVVISHDTEATQRMLAKVKYFLNNIRGPAPIIGNENKNELTFPKTNSTFYIGTAGSRKFGRGDTITHLHCSEVAFWPDPKSLLSGLFQAVPKTGEIALESTGHGVGNYYHRVCMRAASNLSSFTLHFLDWMSFPEYTLDVTPEQADAIMSNLIEEWEEPEYVERFGLTAGQLAWRRMKIEELDYDLRQFKQEYPATLDECFQVSSDSLFYRVRFGGGARWQQVDSNFWLLEGHPRRDCIYTIGVDVGGGVRKDNSVIQVIDAVRGEQVAEWASDRLAPDALAGKIKEIGEKFHFPLLAIESNNHGVLTIKETLRIYPRNLILRGERTDSILDYGFRTTSATKPLLVGELKKSLASDLTIHSDLLRSELSTFIEHDSGRLEAEEGCHDDRVIAIALANYIRTKALLLAPSRLEMQQQRSVNDPFCLDNMLKELHGRGDGYPIRSYVEEAL